MLSRVRFRLNLCLHQTIYVVILLDAAPHTVLEVDFIVGAARVDRGNGNDMVEDVAFQVCILVDVDRYLVTIVRRSPPRSWRSPVRLLSRGERVETVRSTFSGPRREVMSLPHPAHISRRFNQALRCDSDGL